VPRRTFWAWRVTHLAGEPANGPWPTPVLGANEPDVAPTQVQRALTRRGLLLPVRDQAERRQLAKNETPSHLHHYGQSPR
jgi:hypothetical protein